MPDRDWALSAGKPSSTPTPNFENHSNGSTSISVGSIKANVSRRGKITMANASSGRKLLEEYARHRLDLADPKCSALEVEARELRGIPGGDYHCILRLESVLPTEKIYGMGQYQQPFLNLKGTDLELAHRNSQASVPFFISSAGYGLLWNNPAVGRAVLGRNVMSFESISSDIIDYWIVAGDRPADIVQLYAVVTGYAPMMPEYGLGFWQCKLRYQTQEELLNVAREYKRRNIPLDLIVIDYFHRKNQGDWSFDPQFWPDPAAMVKELEELKVELMVSIWPTVAPTSPNWEEMLEKGLIIHHDRGVRVAMQVGGDSTNFDATNPKARTYVWNKAKDNYYRYGIKSFWLDEAEPEYSIYDFDIYRYYQGSNLEIGNIYPREYAKGFYEGMEAEGQKNIVNLLRCAWAGSQKYGALIWSGDIASSWGSFRNQLSAGLNMGMSGIPWWTTDIDGFHGGCPYNPAFRELFTGWFQWGSFCPVMRLHGDREPKPSGQPTASSAANEIWSYGDEVYEICKKYIDMRETMREYTRSLMQEAHTKGSPVMRTMFYEFSEQLRAWEVEHQYMYGSKYLVVPVMEPGQKSVSVWLPEGKWQSWDQQHSWDGGKEVEVDCPIEKMPVFVRL